MSWTGDFLRLPLNFLARNAWRPLRLLVSPARMTSHHMAQVRVSVALWNALETQDFVAAVMNVKSSEGREVRCEYMTATHDWKKFFEGHGTTYTGLAILEHDEAVSHSFRFLKRADLKHYHAYELWLYSCIFSMPFTRY